MTLQAAIEQYVAWRQARGSKFASGTSILRQYARSDGTPLKTRTVHKAFNALRRHAGVRNVEGARYQPRLHDLRHAFATKRLASWYRQGADVQRLLPVLSTRAFLTGAGPLTLVVRFQWLAPVVADGRKLCFRRQPAIPIPAGDGSPCRAGTSWRSRASRGLTRHPPGWFRQRRQRPLHASSRADPHATHPASAVGRTQREAHGSVRRLMSRCAGGPDGARMGDRAGWRLAAIVTAPRTAVQPRDRSAGRCRPRDEHHPPDDDGCAFDAENLATEADSTPRRHGFNTPSSPGATGHDRRVTNDVSALNPSRPGHRGLRGSHAGPARHRRRRRPCSPPSTSTRWVEPRPASYGGCRHQ